NDNNNNNNNSIKNSMANTRSLTSTMIEVLELFSTHNATSTSSSTTSSSSGYTNIDLLSEDWEALAESMAMKMDELTDGGVDEISAPLFTATSSSYKPDTTTTNSQQQQQFNNDDTTTTITHNDFTESESDSMSMTEPMLNLYSTVLNTTTTTATDANQFENVQAEPATSTTTTTHIELGSLSTYPRLQSNKTRVPVGVEEASVRAVRRLRGVLEHLAPAGGKNEEDEEQC
ncbi:hypothetical protein HDU76_004331, partial [Blyttiomyces sp. JEL0837]